MRHLKPILTIVAGGALLSLGICLVFAAFLCLVVFRDGSLERTYLEKEKVANFWNGIWAVVGAVACLGGGAALLWWGLQRTDPPPDQENQNS